MRSVEDGKLPIGREPEVLWPEGPPGGLCRPGEKLIPIPESPKGFSPPRDLLGMTIVEEALPLPSLPAGGPEVPASPAPPPPAAAVVTPGMSRPMVHEG